MSETKNNKNNKAIAYWLLSCCALVIAIIIVGAITRLTGSGLSMVEWRPLIGALPPLNNLEWTRVFDLYKASPQFKIENTWMGIDDFKSIFFWEWAHRFLGRVIGMAYLLPFLFFLARKMVPNGYKLKLFSLFLLGGMQGFMGWYMVQSGLIDDPSVSHFRLAAHLSLAIILLCLMFWTALHLLNNSHRNAPTPALHAHGWMSLIALCATIIWGAFVAGLDAGLVYNETFPLMGGHILPPDIWQNKPLWENFFNLPSGVQFIHRWLAIATAIILLCFSWRGIKTKMNGYIFHFLGGLCIFQIILGVSTLLSGVMLPLAVMHQGIAIALLLTLITAIYKIRIT